MAAPEIFALKRNFAYILIDVVLDEIRGGSLLGFGHVSHAQHDSHL
jgi:hypothetical protein